MNCCCPPSVIEGMGGVTAIETSVGTIVTVRTVEPTILLVVALIVDEPAPTAVAKPCMPAALLTVATVLLLELQVTESVRL
jgi:hypothetical protein